MLLPISSPRKYVWVSSLHTSVLKVSRLIAVGFESNERSCFARSCRSLTVKRFEGSCRKVANTALSLSANLRSGCCTTKLLHKSKATQTLSQTLASIIVPIPVVPERALETQPCKEQLVCV